MGVEIMQGVEELKTAFLQLSQDMELRASREMVVAAGGVLKKEAKSLAQKQGLKKSGALIDNIVIKREKTQQGIAQYNLGVRHGKDLGRKAKKVLTVKSSGRIGVKYVNNPFYWSFLEFGRNIYRGTTRAKNMNSKRKRMKTTKNIVGRVEATPYIAPSLVNKRAEAIEAMNKRLQKRLEKANR